MLMMTRLTARTVRKNRRDARATVCIDRPTPPYAGVVAQGHARSEQVAYQALAVPLGVRYLGQEAGALIGTVYARLDLMTIRVAIAHLPRWDFGQACRRPPIFLVPRSVCTWTLCGGSIKPGA
jgi:hypothetical protein